MGRPDPPPYRNKRRRRSPVIRAVMFFVSSFLVGGLLLSVAVSVFVFVDAPYSRAEAAEARLVGDKIDLNRSRQWSARVRPFFTEYPTLRVPDEHREFARRMMDAEALPPTFTVDLLDDRIALPDDLWETQFGWPLRCFTSVVEGAASEFRPVYGCRVVARPARARPWYGVLPTHIHPRNFSINAFCWGIIVLLPVQMGRVVRAYWRKRCGRCTHCGYSLIGLPDLVCSECGEPLDRPRVRSVASAR